MTDGFQPPVTEYSIALPDVTKLLCYRGVYSGKCRRTFVSTVLSFLPKYCRKFLTVITISSLPRQERPYVMDGALLTSTSAAIDTVPHTVTQLAFCCYLFISRHGSTDTTAKPDVLSVDK